MDSETLYSVGQLAKLAGITVRTLQYYDGCGLLSCSHSEGGRRLYTRSDLMRLQQILFFKSFGFPLKEIRDRLLDISSGEDLAKMLEQQKAALLCQIEALQQNERQLGSVVDEIKRYGDISPEQILAIMDVARRGNLYAFMLRYFSTNQMDVIVQRFSEGKEETALRFEQRTGEIFSEVQRLYRNGADPTGAQAQALAAELWQMSVAFSGGDPEMMKSMFSIGVDAENWPDEVNDLRSAIKEFLSRAMYEFLTKQGIPFETLLRQEENESE